jgi:hypothetical protein
MTFPGSCLRRIAVAVNGPSPTVNNLGNGHHKNRFSSFIGRTANVIGGFLRLNRKSSNVLVHASSSWWSFFLLWR